MKLKSKIKYAAVLLSTLPALNAHAALIDRGNGMIYDSTQNITWLQDANYAKTSGYDADGLMTWYQSQAWADNLVYGGFSDWRLASAGLNGTNGTFSYNGSTDYSYNNTRSEIGHLYYELGNLGYYNTDGVYQPGYGLTHTGSFLNVQNYIYWEGERYVPLTNVAWAFIFDLGLQNGGGKSNLFYAWAVRAGDVAAVPVPAAAWLFGSGLMGLAGAARRKYKTA